MDKNPESRILNTLTLSESKPWFTRVVYTHDAPSGCPNLNIHGAGGWRKTISLIHRSTHRGVCLPSVFSVHRPGVHQGNRIG